MSNEVYERIEVRPLAGALGAEVSGAQLGELDDATFAEIHRAWLAHEVLFFRDQDLGPEQHKAFGRRFGALQVHPFLHSRAPEGHPEIVVLESSAERPVVAAGWHTDVTFAERPPMASILRGVDVPAWGGDTMWASCRAAYDALSPTMQRMLEGLVAVHDTSKTFSRGAYPSERRPDANDTPTALHPVVRTHPETARKSIFVNPAFTLRIKGLRPAESDALLKFLYQHVTTPEFTCRFHWTKNAVALWDNRCTQHRVVADNLKAYRRMERVTVEGDRPA
ncbi:MAG: taurine dioxygenase [Proteobacteria bacterium]|nr:MAG: taurine dioxygenase [Pseudomonadota bacterium]